MHKARPSLHSACNDDRSWEIQVDDAPNLITVGVIAGAAGTTPDPVRRILRTRMHIKPAAYAANVWLFTSEAIAQVRYQINAIDAT